MVTKNRGHYFPPTGPQANSCGPQTRNSDQRAQERDKDQGKPTSKPTAPHQGHTNTKRRTNPSTNPPPPTPTGPSPTPNRHTQKKTDSRAHSLKPTRPSAAGEPMHGAPPLITDGDRPSILAMRAWHNPDSSPAPTTAQPHALKKDDNPHPSPQPGNRLTPYDTTLALSPVQ